jgi:hypothetical protein
MIFGLALTMDARNINRKYLLILAVAALSVGALVYLVDRQSEHIYFIPKVLTLADGLGPLFGRIGNSLPSFLHVYAFILITVVVIGNGPVLTPILCITWFSVENMFEAAQHSGIAYRVLEHVPKWFQGIPFLENTSAYFQAGTFDILDVISISLGTFAAYLTILLTISKEVRYVLHK